MKRILAAAATASVAALALMPVAPSSAQAGGDATVSVLHAVPGLTVDVYANGEELIPDFEPGTLTDPLSLPALLSSTLPLGPDRRRITPGPLRDAVLDRAAELLAGLLPTLADDPARLAFVPGPLAAGEVDAVLGAAVLRALRTAPSREGSVSARRRAALESIAAATANRSSLRRAGSPPVARASSSAR